MVPRAPDAQLPKSPNPLVEAFNYQMIYIDAYVVHVDFVSQQEVAYKLTQSAISALIRYHRNVYLVDVAASTWDWPEKQAQIERLHADFVQAVNRFVFRTDKKALEGMEERGAGELLEKRSIEAKNAILSLFMPLMPPPPEMLEVVVQAPASIPSGSDAGGAWFSAVPSQTMSSSSGGHHPTSAPPSVLPSQSSPACTQLPLDFAAMTDLSSLDLDLGLGLDILATSSSFELPSPALTMDKASSHLLTTTGTSPFAPSLITSNDFPDFSSSTSSSGSLSVSTSCFLDQSIDQSIEQSIEQSIAAAMSTPSASVSPLSESSFVNPGLSPIAMANPCGQNLVATPLLDYGFVPTPSTWAYPDTFTPLYGTAT